MKHLLTSQSTVPQAPVFPLTQQPRPDFLQTQVRSTRYRLWELQSCWHCMVVGTCLTLAEVRQQAGKAGLPVKDATDYEIHQLAVENAENGKHPLSQRLQKLLERKFTVTVKQFRAARDEAALTSLWESGWTSGQVPASLWALITHPLATRAIILEVFGQVHMMSHLSGASTCVDRGRLQEQERQLASLNKDLQSLRLRHEQTSQALHDQTRQTDALQIENRKLQAQLQLPQSTAPSDETTHASNRAREAATQLQTTQLQEKVEVLQDLLIAERADRHHLQLDVQRLEQLLEARLGQTLPPDIDTVPPADCPAARDLKLCGQCVLYLGGKAQQRRHFQALVESCEGRFLHHDGGRETCPHRISELVSQADVVMCPTDCISHSAMQKARTLCAKQDKPMIFMQRSSLSAFTRSLYETLS
ncbi:DUF2325 domain-containing protein [Granulosicoccus sp. 3-233]|uniref:DUF2325 domain-containing protein n=1 Tax=Granulosicoccus sp. 3-233 TaxID=3417969 RepID=UPI003D337049